MQYYKIKNNQSKLELEKEEIRKKERVRDVSESEFGLELHFHERGTPCPTICCEYWLNGRIHHYL